MSRNSETSLLSRDSRYIWHPFGALKSDWEVLPVISGKGAYLALEDGRTILDAISSWWVNLHGHANPEMVEAIRKQTATLEQVIFSGFTHQPAVDIAQRLIELLPGNMRRAFFSDDGSTAVEVAIKISIQYWYNQGQEKNKLIALEGAYHGDTFGAMSVGDRSDFTKPFHNNLFEVEFIPFPTNNNTEATLAALEKVLAQDDIAGFIYEPLVQGAGGMRIYSPEILDRMIRLAKSQGVLCIADEVMTGFGRTGKLMASMHCQEVPDIICLSKGITGGYLPMGLTVGNAKVEAAFMSSESRKALYHGHSYTANPIACAAANASLDILLRPETQEQIAMIERNHRQFIGRISTYQNIELAGSCGTILSIELKVEEGSGYFSTLRKRLYNFFLNKNILLRPLGNTIYIMPPYVITEEDLGQVYSAIEDFLKEY
jgi:adenosylmethionine-8-amino-7-oxononanoate aminotransferase